MNETRELWKQYHQQHMQIADEWRKRGYKYPPPQFPIMPDMLRELRCGAKAKSTGHPCKRKDLYLNGRCKLHGGLSTGPKTYQGKLKSAKNGFKPKIKN